MGHTLLAEGAILVTTDSVLVEFLTFLSAGGGHVRRAARQYVETVYSHPSFVVVPQSPELFAAGLDLYSRRPDKTYSMVDCISMVVCGTRGINDVLTYDHDFEQEGLRALLRERRRR